MVVVVGAVNPGNPQMLTSYPVVVRRCWPVGPGAGGNQKKIHATEARIGVEAMA